MSLEHPANTPVLDRTWVEVDLDRIASNVDTLKHSLRPGTEILGVIKADAYGHGAVAVAGTLLQQGVTRLAVSLLDEALELREHGITAPILLLSYTDPRRAEEVVRRGIIQSAYSWELLEALNEAGRKLNRPARVHIKLDTGMGRIGFQSGFDSLHEIRNMMQLPFIRVEGIFTHFSTADEEDPAYAQWQFGQFLSLCQELERAGLHIPLKHCCNSAATLRAPAYHMDLVRPGGLLYGFVPAFIPEAVRASYQPAMRFCSSVIHLKTLPAGQSIGYNRSFITKRETRVATVPVGYADGYSRSLSDRAEALVHGRRVPVLGRICMDACMFDVTEVPEAVSIGDEVVLFGEQRYLSPSGEIRQEEVSTQEFANWMHTIDYEVSTNLGKRVPRAYFQSGAVIGVSRTLDVGTLA